MSGDTYYFNRYEFKYWVDQYTRERLLDYLSNFTTLDANNIDGRPYDICSLYLDTRNMSCYYEKYDGDVFRKKYRIRFYGYDTSRMSLEIKEKHNLFIKKRRQFVTLEKDNPARIPETLLAGDADHDASFVHAYRALNLEPVVWVAYRRTALVGNNNPNLRITFDDDLAGCQADGLRFRFAELLPVALSRWNRRTILEIKFNNYLPLWLEQCVRDLNLSHESISKYGININRFHFRQIPVFGP